MGNWYDDPTTVGRDRLRAILAGIEAPPTPLSREAQVRLLVACYRAQGYLMFEGHRVAYWLELDSLYAEGKVSGEGDYNLVEEVLAYNVDN